MRIACLQHVPFEGPAAIGAWAASHGYPLAITRLFASEPVPPPESFDFLLIMGGPMSVNDKTRFDWLDPEKAFVRSAIQHNKLVLGICLGAQLIASAMGAKVIPSGEREIGWYPVHRTSEGGRHRVFGLMPEEFVPLHWHGETYQLPDGASRLAASKSCRQQAFAFGERVLGLQFHLESTPESVDALIRNCPRDLAPGPFVQESHAMASAHARFKASNRLMTTLLDRFVTHKPLPG